MEKAVVYMLAILSHIFGVTFRFQHKSKVEDEGF